MSRQAVVTVVFGRHAEELDVTFTSFRKNPNFELHAFVIGESLPERQVEGVEYHLKQPDPSYSTLIRDADFRRWMFIDELGVDYALVVDGRDVLCLKPIPDIPDLLRGCSVGAVGEHPGGRYVIDGIYCGNFVNAGVTFWNIEKSREIRHKVIDHGSRYYRNDVDDQLSLNEVIFTSYIDDLMLLPCIYNYRAYLNRKVKGWPTTSTFDGVRIYHHDECLKALEQSEIRDQIPLPSLPTDPKPLTKRQQFFRKVKQRLNPHLIR